MSCVAASSAAEPAPARVLHHHLEAAGGADAAHRRRRDGDDEGVLDRGRAAGADRPGSRSALRPLAARSSNGASAEKMAPALGALVKVAPSKPAKGTACATPGVSRMIWVASPHDRVGARQRGAGRQLQHGDQIALVLVGNEAGRRAAELPAGQADEPGIDDEDQHRDAEQPRGQRAIAGRQPVEAAVEAAEESRERARQRPIRGRRAPGAA